MSKQNEFKLLGDRILVAMIRTPGSYETENLQLFVPAIAREVMNIGVVHSASEIALKKGHVQKGDVVLTLHFKGQQCPEVMVRNFDLDEKKHWMLFESEDVLGVLTNDFRV